MERYDRMYKEYLESKFKKKEENNEAWLFQVESESMMNVRLLELEPLIRFKCTNPNSKDLGMYDDKEYNEYLSKEDDYYFCKFKIVIGIEDVKIRIEMSSVLRLEEDENIIGENYFDDNIMVYFNDVKIDSREVQGNYGDSNKWMEEYFEREHNGASIYHEDIILFYMKAILRTKNYRYYSNPRNYYSKDSKYYFIIGSDGKCYKLEDLDDDDDVKCYYDGNEKIHRKIDFQTI